MNRRFTTLALSLLVGLASVQQTHCMKKGLIIAGTTTLTLVILRTLFRPTPTNQQPNSAPQVQNPVQEPMQNVPVQNPVQDQEFERRRQAALRRDANRYPQYPDDMWRYDRERAVEHTLFPILKKNGLTDCTIEFGA